MNNEKQLSSLFHIREQFEEQILRRIVPNSPGLRSSAKSRLHHVAHDPTPLRRGRGVSVSVNALMLEALQADIESVKDDADFIGTLRRLTERDKEILDRLAG